MIKNADRYTLLETHPNDLAGQIEKAKSLGLKYFVTDSTRSDICNLFLFFDESGRDNYLTRVWGDEADRISEIIQSGIDDDERYVDTLDKIKARLGYPVVNAPQAD